MCPRSRRPLPKASAEFVDKGGFLFAMCGATESLDLAIAAFTVDIAGPFSDGTPPDADADAKMEWTAQLAFPARTSSRRRT